MEITRRQFSSCLLACFFSADPLQEIAQLLEKATSAGWFSAPEITACVIDICYGQDRFTRVFGHASTAETEFVISSITKPIVATAMMVLQDRNEISLENRVSKYLPEFHDDGRTEVTIRHLLTHTAGLPDTLPNMHELVKQQASLEDLFVRTCGVPLLFKPGTACSYSNLGVLLGKEILERITRKTLHDFLQDEIFRPLSMNSTTLGPGAVPPIHNQPKPDKTDVNHNSEIGSPWGGVCSTAADLTRLLHYFANPHDSPLKKESAASMLRNQNEGLNQPWGIGWMLARSHDAYHEVAPSWHRYGWASVFGNPEQMPAFGLQCSGASFGHYGVTGTLAWADPQRHISLVFLSTKSVRHSRDGVLGSISDLASGLALKTS